jgi:hypothetical protein
MQFLLNVYGNISSCIGSLEALQCDERMLDSPDYNQGAPLELFLAADMSRIDLSMTEPSFTTMLWA